MGSKGLARPFINNAFENTWRMMDCNQMLDAFGWMQMLSMQRNAEIALFKEKKMKAS